MRGRLWTGPAGHLLGGALDLLAALTRYALATARGRAMRSARPLRGVRRGR